MKLKVFGIAILALLLVAMAVSARPETGLIDVIGLQPVQQSGLTIEQVKVNGNVINPGETLVVKRGDNLDITVKIHADNDYSHLLLQATLLGYDYDEERELVSDMISGINLKAGDTVFKELHLTVPTDMNKIPTRILLLLSDSNSVTVASYIDLRIDGVDRKHSIVIQDFSLSPSRVIAGRGVDALVNVKNIGDKTLDFVKVTVSIPELGIDASEYIDELKPEEAKTFSELSLFIPRNTNPGTYQVVVKVEFDHHYSVTKTGQVVVVGKEASNNTGKTLVTVPGEQLVAIGKEVAFPVVITNQGSTTKTYNLELKNIDWASTRVEPGTVVVVNPGESKTVYIYITPLGTTTPGEKTFTLTISDGSTTQNAVLTANVVKATTSSNTLKLVLEIILVVLVIVLVIIGLVLAFRKTKNEEEEPYY